MDGGTRVRKLLPLPDRLPLGYHEMVVEAAGMSAAVRFIVTPRARLAFRRTWAAAAAPPASPSASTVCARSATGAAAISETCSKSWTSPPGTGVRLRGPQPAPRHPQPPAVQYQPVPAELHLLPEFPLSRRGEHGGFRALAPRPRNCAPHPRSRPKSRPCAHSEFVEYERVSALKLRFLKMAVRGVSARVAHAARARAANSSAFWTAKAICWRNSPLYCALDEHLHRRNPDVWIWTAVARRRTGTRLRRKPRAFRQKHWRSVMFYQYLQWQIDIQLPRAQRRARDRQPVHRPLSRSGAGHRPLRLRPVGASPLLRLRLPRRLAARRFLAQGPGLGLSAAQLRGATARTATACSPNPSARTAATAARCASTT